MKTLKWIMLIMAQVWATNGFGFSSDGSSLTRNISTSLALTNSLVTVSVTFTNGQTDALRGFYYSEYLPSEIVMTTERVRINGQAITNYSVEAGGDSELYSGRKASRWILEEPPGFTQANAVPGYGTVQVTYTLSSAAAGTFHLDEFNWVAYNPLNASAAFGYSEQLDQLTLVVVDNPVAPSLGCSCSGEGFRLSVVGMAGAAYSLETSTNLVVWLPLATVSAPSVFVDTNLSSFGEKYYRARWVTGK